MKASSQKPGTQGIKHGKIEFSLVLGLKYIYEGIWPIDYGRRLALAKRTSLSGEIFFPFFSSKDL